MLEVEVAIIGQGIIGQSIAFRFIQGCRKIAVFVGDEPNCGTSAAQAIVSLKGATYARQPLFAAKQRGTQRFRNWIEAISQATSETIVCSYKGAVEGFQDEKDYQILVERLAHGEAHGVRHVKIEPIANLQDRLPAKSKIIGGIVYPEDSHTCPKTLTLALKNFISKSVPSFNKVSSLSQVGNRWQIESEGNIVYSDYVVVAAGPWTNSILRLAAVEPIKLYEVPGSTFVHSDIKHLSEGCLLLHGKSALAQSLRWTSFGGEQQDRAFFSGAYGIEFESFVEQRGVRVRTRSRFPMVQSMVKNGQKQRIIVATGFYKNGFQLAPEAADSVFTYVTQRGVEDHFMRMSRHQNAK